MEICAAKHWRRKHGLTRTTEYEQTPPRPGEADGFHFHRQRQGGSVPPAAAALKASLDAQPQGECAVSAVEGGGTSVRRFISGVEGWATSW